MDSDEESVEEFSAEEPPAVDKWGALRASTWEFLTHSSALPWGLWWVSLSYQIAMALLVVVLFVVDNTGRAPGQDGVPVVTTFPYWVAELALTIIWSAEYILRLWSCTEADDAPVTSRRCSARRRMLFHPLMVFDMLSIISLVVDLSIDSNMYRGLSSLRLLMVFRFEREFNLFGPVLHVIWQKGSLLLATLGIAGVVLLIGSVTMFYIESPHNEAFSSVLNSMWWCTTALTTVGYGDIYPTTPAGRALGSLVAFLGIGLFSLPAGILASGFQESWEEQRVRRSKWHRHRRPTGSSPSPSPFRHSSYDESEATPFGAEALQRLEQQQASIDAVRADVAALREELRSALRK